MPRFFLDILDGRKLLADPEGQDFADLNAALAEAAASARDLVAYGLMRNEDVSGRSIVVRDEDGEPLATVPFRSALPGKLREEPPIVSLHPAQLCVAANINVLVRTDR